VGRGVIVLLTLLVTACGGGGSGGAPQQQAQAAGLSISGTPPSSVTQGISYSFVPVTNNPDGSTLTFSITNKPAWAAFNSTSGMLSGTPGTGDVGSYAGIVISVSDGTASDSLTAFAVEVVGSATGAATLSWTAPVQNEDGSPLMDLGGYKVYYGLSAGNYTNTDTIINSGVTSHMVENLSPGTWFFVVTAFDRSGNESQPSASASKTI